MVVEAEVGGGEIICHGHGNGRVDSFHKLPEGCIANVISFTTPRDACRLSLLSSTFRSAAQSDVVWDRFLPSDYHTIISQSSAGPSSLCFASKKELYLHLSQNPLLIDGGKKSFALDKVYGKKCYMLSARSLFIVWGDTPRYWRWTSVPEARFSEVAELVRVCWLEIGGLINTAMLSPETLYGAYLVFKPSTAGSYGFDYKPVEVSIGIVGADDTRRQNVYLDEPTGRRRRYQIVHRRGGAGIFNPMVSVAAPAPAPAPAPIDPTRENLDLQCPKERADGWLEIELGDFFNKGGEDKELKMGVYEIKGGDWKGGLVVQGIEIRPKQNE